MRNENEIIGKLISYRLDGSKDVKSTFMSKEEYLLHLYTFYLNYSSKQPKIHGFQIYVEDALVLEVGQCS